MFRKRAQGPFRGWKPLADEASVTWWYPRWIFLRHCLLLGVYAEHYFADRWIGFHCPRLRRITDKQPVVLSGRNLTVAIKVSSAGELMNFDCVSTVGVASLVPVCMVISIEAMSSVSICNSHIYIYIYIHSRVNTHASHDVAQNFESHRFSGVWLCMPCGGPAISTLSEWYSSLGLISDSKRIR